MDRKQYLGSISSVAISASLAIVIGHVEIPNATKSADVLQRIEALRSLFNSDAAKVYIDATQPGENIRTAFADR